MCHLTLLCKLQVLHLVQAMHADHMAVRATLDQQKRHHSDHAVSRSVKCNLLEMIIVMIMPMSADPALEFNTTSTVASWPAA